jgi:hypothetical protein
VPEDRAGARRAVRDGRPLVGDGRSHAGRALLALAERAHGDRLRLAPAEPPTAGEQPPRPPALAIRRLAEVLRRLGASTAGRWRYRSPLPAPSMPSFGDPAAAHEPSTNVRGGAAPAGRASVERSPTA